MYNTTHTPLHTTIQTHHTYYYYNTPHHTTHILLLQHNNTTTTHTPLLPHTPLFKHTTQRTLLGICCSVVWCKSSWVAMVAPTTMLRAPLLRHNFVRVRFLVKVQQWQEHPGQRPCVQLHRWKWCIWRRMIWRCCNQVRHPVPTSNSFPKKEVWYASECC